MEEISRQGAKMPRKRSLLFTRFDPNFGFSLRLGDLARILPD